ncbi:MAG: nuclear transport factor 2 family protein, partial [bacterium]|nr:nuclear transport factor 2 family protein [bacterium]
HYHNEYHFLLRIRGGQVVEFKEYMDTALAAKVLVGGQ